MGLLKTLVIGTLAVLGGCTVVVGGCTVGAVKTSVKLVGEMAESSGETHFNKLYNEDPEDAEAKYTEVANKCYSDKMRLTLGMNVPEHVVIERVNFDIYEFRIKQMSDQNHIQHLAAWRNNSDKKIVASIADKTQRRAVKKYLQRVNKKGDLLETLCVAGGLSPETNNKPTIRQASIRR